MTRIPKKAGFVSVSTLPRGPNGLPQCRQCGKETPSKRRTFCSDGCVHSWKLTTDPNYQRRHVFERDNGVCQICGIDTKEQRDGIIAEWVAKMVEAGVMHPGDEVELNAYYGCNMVKGVRRALDWVVKQWAIYPEHTNLLKDAAAEQKLPWSRFRRGPVWDMDHTVPVAEGGGGCGLENLRTLCRACHLKVTADLRKRIARKPKPSKGIS